ncbi:MAG: amino acid adenylation domain-containing protein, partial [Actinomycetota bacterium]|nr:amino acid adenylation domain-containing protein [Actinomycetota bacterium]
PGQAPEATPDATDDQHLAATLDYWTSKIGDHTCMMPRLKADAPRRAVIRSLELDAQATSFVHALADSLDVDPFTVLASGIQVFLASHTGSTDVLFAYTTTADDNDALGNHSDGAFFRSTSPMDRTFREIIQDNAAQIRNDQYFHLPIVEVAAGLHHRYRNHVVTTNVQVAPAVALPETCSGGSLTLTLRPDYTIEHIDEELEIRYRIDLEQIHLDLLVDESAEGFLQMLGEGLASTLAQLGQAPDTPIEHVELVSPQLRAQLLSARNMPRRIVEDQPRTLHEVIQRHATQSPDAPAIRDAESSSTFETFNGKANQMARLLLDLHQNDDRPTVSVLMSRASRIATTVLAVLKTGGRYVVIDDEYPDSRVQYIIEDSGSNLVITDHDNASRLTGVGHQVTVVNLDDGECRQSIASLKSTDLSIESSESDDAYVIYTSGTTGKPKGIQVTHHNVRNLFDGCIDLFDTTGEARHGHLNSFSFDATVIGLWFSLLSGNELVVLNREEFMTPTDLANSIRHYRLTHCFVPNALVNSYGLEAPGTFADLKFLSYGGEKPNYASLVSIHRQCVGLRQLNVYGPTEITVMCTIDVIDPTRPYSDTVPIGHPLPNYACYIVDKNGHLQLPGAPGELWISGASLSRGYVNLPEKTATAFLPNPFHDDTPDSIGSTPRCYRSGDLVRWLPDGRIEFLGRIDAQVKIRGFRIELDEVTEAVRRSPGVSNAIVVATVLPGAQEKDLVAFVISDRPNPDEAALRKQLESILPHYMIPRHIVFLDEFPCTTSGKFDTRTLIASLGETADQEITAEDASGSDQECCLRAMLVDILGEHAAIAVDEDIFTLGVHSLMLSRFVSRVQKDLDVPL